MEKEDGWKGSREMIKPEQIPKEVLRSFDNAAWGNKSDAEIIAAAINAWPEAERMRRRYKNGRGVFLPLHEKDG